MLFRRRRAAAVDDDPNVIVEPGPSLAKGPAMITGAVLVAFGLSGLLQNADFPSASANFPDGLANGTRWLGFEVNGWTDFFAITAGALLLFGAAQHHLAKTMSLLVGLALCACAVIAIIDGQDVLGLAAANFWTKVGFAVAGVAMLLNALMPRTTRRRVVSDGTYDGDTVATERRGRFGRPVRRDREVVDDDRTTVAPRDGAV
jgi:hypothetical protein